MKHVVCRVLGHRLPRRKRPFFLTDRYQRCERCGKNLEFLTAASFDESAAEEVINTIAVLCHAPRMQMQLIPQRSFAADHGNVYKIATCITFGKVD